MACTCGPGQVCQPLKPGCWGYQAPSLTTADPWPVALAKMLSPESSAALADAMLGTCTCGEPVEPGFMVCLPCWHEFHKDERPAMPWEI